MDSIDYDSIARVYDTFADTNYDHEFFVSQIKAGAKVLELTSGTGRLSIPLILAGAELTCVDVSRGMLDVLEEKLTRKNLSAQVVCTDIEQLDFESEFSLAILPFQSFMELIGERKQVNTLRTVYRALVPGGRFFCTMHNPEIRRKTVDGCLRFVGTFPIADGTLVVSGFEQGGSPVVTRNQFFECFDATGGLQSKSLLQMKFEFIEEDQFETMASSCGFEVVNLYGWYDRSGFSTSGSPVMIWELKRGGA